MGYMLDCVRNTILVEDTLADARLRGLPLVDAAAVADAVSGQTSLRLVDRVVASGAARGVLHAAVRLVAAVRVTDSVTGRQHGRLVDGAVVADALRGTSHPAPVRDSALITDALRGVRSVRAALADRAVTRDRLRTHRRYRLVDTVLASDASAGVRRQLSRTVDALQATDRLGGASGTTGRLRDSARASDALRGTLRARGRFVAVALAQDRSGDRYGGEVWVTNLASGAASYWRGVDAVAAAEWRGRLVVATGHALYALDGAANVPAGITTPRTDFGSQALKRVGYVYAEGPHAGAEVLVAASKGSGAPAVARYTMVAYDRGMSRAVVGRGLEGRYWQFSLRFAQPVRLRSMAADLAVNRKRIA